MQMSQGVRETDRQKHQGTERPKGRETEGQKDRGTDLLNEEIQFHTKFVIEIWKKLCHIAALLRIIA